MSQNYPLFVKRDIDGFFGLFIDNLVQFLAILALCSNPFICGMTGENSFYLYRYIFPGAAVSILFGNLFYSWQARRLALRENRSDVTALPYGINTPSMLVFIFFVLGACLCTDSQCGGRLEDRADCLFWKWRDRIYLLLFCRIHPKAYASGGSAFYLGWNCNWIHCDDIHAADFPQTIDRNAPSGLNTDRVIFKKPLSVGAARRPACGARRNDCCLGSDNICPVPGVSS